MGPQGSLREKHAGFYGAGEAQDRARASSARAVGSEVPAARCRGSSSPRSTAWMCRSTGYPAGWFESRAAYDQAMASPQWADLAADGASIFRVR